jgi:hypothetical protein
MCGSLDSLNRDRWRGSLTSLRLGLSEDLQTKASAPELMPLK